MALNYTDGIIKISKANYETLVNGGDVEGYTYDPHAIYLVLDDGGGSGGDYLPLSGGTMSGAIDMGSNAISNVNGLTMSGDINMDGHDITKVWEISNESNALTISSLLGLTLNSTTISMSSTNTNSSVIYIGNMIYPATGSTIDLGTDGNRWNNGYFKYLYTENGGFQSSDIRKKNVHGELDLDKAYDLIEKCSAIVYDLKDDESHKEQIGLIAQEVQEFFPEIVNEDKDGFLSLDYAKLTVIILRVLKDLIDRVKNIENAK